MNIFVYTGLIQKEKVCINGEHSKSAWQVKIEALKEAGLADLEILKIVFDSVDSQINGSISVPRQN